MFYVLNLIAALHARVEDAKDRGATATEYAMLVAFIAIVITAGVDDLRQPAQHLVQQPRQQDRSEQVVRARARPLGTAGPSSPRVHYRWGQEPMGEQG